MQIEVLGNNKEYVRYKKHNILGQHKTWSFFDPPSAITSRDRLDS
jgi:hypothetical protein